MSGKYDREAAPFVKLWKDTTSRTGVRGNSLKIFPQRACTEIRKNSFALRIAKTWNCLPDSVIIAQIKIYYMMTTSPQSPEWEMKLK